MFLYQEQTFIIGADNFETHSGDKKAKSECNSWLFWVCPTDDAHWIYKVLRAMDKGKKKIQMCGRSFWKAFILSAFWARTVFTSLAWSSFFVDAGIPQALFPRLFVIFMDTVGCGRGLEGLQLCDIKMPSLLFWNLESCSFVVAGARPWVENSKERRYFFFPFRLPLTFCSLNLSWCLINCKN